MHARSVALLCAVAAAVALACNAAVASAGSVVDDRACHAPGHTSYPFCDTSLSKQARVADLVSRIQDDDKPKLLTARGWPQGTPIGLPYLGVPAHDWGLNCVHGIQSTAVNTSDGTMVAPTSFPNPVGLGASWNMTNTLVMGKIMGVELRAAYLAGATEPSAWSGKAHIGLDCWSPNINLNRDPRWGRNVEVASEDPLINGKYGVAYTQGIQQGDDPRYVQGISTLKHMAAYSLEDSDGFTRHTFNAVVSPSDLADSYLPAFKASITTADAKGVMCQYSEVNSVPACASPFFAGLLDQWNYTGYVTSDTDAVGDIYNTHKFTKTKAEACCKAIRDGRCDIDSGGTYHDNLMAMLEKGATECNMTDIDRALTHAYGVLFDTGIFDPIDDQPYWKVPPEAVGTPASQEANLFMTKQSMMLLKNRKSVLPFKAEAKQYAVIGPHGNATSALLGNYLGDVCPGGFGDSSCVTSTLDAITATVKAAGGSVEYALGTDVTKNSTSGDFEAAIKAASAADYVIIGAGIDMSVESESHDRTDIDLPEVQHQLIAAVLALGKPTAIFLLNGGMVGIAPELAYEGPLGIIEAHYAGFQGAAAIADTLFGANNPGGKLAYTLYDPSYTDAIKMDNMNMTAVFGSPGRSYRYYTGTPLLKFGFGLSYTSFDLAYAPGTRGADPISMPTANRFDSASTTLGVAVRNTGDMDGDEVVQVYMTPTSLPTQPGVVGMLKRQLIAFERVHVASGDAAIVVFDIAAADLSVVDPATGDRVSAPGSFDITITNGVEEVLTAKVTLTGRHTVLDAFPEAP